MHSLGIFLAGLIDYAGLFPPAARSMDAAVREYAAHRAGRYCWALGRFVAPVARLEEFERAAGGHARAWPLSALASSNLEADLRKICSSSVEAIEVKVATPEEILQAAKLIPAPLEAYFEVPIADGGPVDQVRAIAKAGARAKVRTGGVTPEAFPASADLAGFLGACHAAGVAFKATAGLHHPVRSVQRLTCEPDSPTHRMHGFLNVFLAAAFVRAGMDAAEAARLLEETSPEAFRFASGGVCWRAHRLGNHQLAETRQKFALSFGSCSFQEPIDDLKKLGLL